MPQALKSRKFWLTVGSVAGVITTNYFGFELDPAVIAGIAGIVLSYNFGQGWVDKTMAQEGIKAETDIAKAQMTAYIQRLQAELAAYAAEVPDISPNGVAEITE